MSEQLLPSEQCRKRNLLLSHPGGNGSKVGEKEAIPIHILTPKKNSLPQFPCLPAMGTSLPPVAVRGESKTVHSI